MNPKESPEITLQTLLALRKENDALRIITEKLGVKGMGPADHIRTKHEVKIFLESGDVKAAENLLKLAIKRRALNQSQSAREKFTQQEGQRMRN